jgi:hypothetical protein
LIRIIAFEIVLLAACGFSWWKGGAPERAVAAMMVAAACASSAVSLWALSNYDRVIWGLFIVDGLLLAGLALVSMWANRYWPIWVTALQFDAVAIHLARAYDPAIVPLVYAWGVGKIGYAMLALLAIGVSRHQQRVRETGPEPGWCRNDADGHNTADR